jgi:hypothetical protein
MKLTDNPVVYSNAVKSILAMLVVLGAVTLSGEQVAAIVVAVEAVLGIIVFQSVTPNTKVAQKVDDANTAGYQQAVAEVSQLHTAVLEQAASQVETPEAPARKRPVVARKAPARKAPAGKPARKK